MDDPGQRLKEERFISTVLNIPEHTAEIKSCENLLDYVESELFCTLTRFYSGETSVQHNVTDNPNMVLRRKLAGKNHAREAMVYLIDIWERSRENSYLKN